MSYDSDTVDRAHVQAIGAMETVRTVLAEISDATGTPSLEDQKRREAALFASQRILGRAIDRLNDSEVEARQDRVSLELEGERELASVRRQGGGA